MIADHGGFDLLLELGGDALAGLAAGAVPLVPVTRNINLPALGVSGPATFTPTVASVQPVAGPALNITLDVALDWDANTPVGPVTIGEDSDAPIRATVTVNLGVNGLQLVANTAGGLNPVVTVDLSEDAGVTVILAEVAATAGPAAAEAALVALQQALANALVNALGAVPAVTVPLFTFPANLTPTSPATVPPLVIGVARGALLIGVTLGGTPGALAAVTNDNLFEASGEAISMVISNRALLQDLVRSAVVAGFPLPAGGFIAGHPFFWTGSLAVVNTDLGPINLTSVRASTAGPNRVLLDMAVRGNLAEGAVSVNARLRATATIGLAIVGGALTLTLTVAPIAVLNASADIAWWVYAAAAFGGGALLAAAVLVVDLVADGIIRDEIAARINTGMFPNVSVALPAGLGGGLVPGRVVMLLGPPRVTLGSIEIANDLLLTLRNA